MFYIFPMTISHKKAHSIWNVLFLYFAKFMERIDPEKHLSLQILAGNDAHIAAVIAALAVVPHDKYRILRHCHIHQSIGHAICIVLLQKFSVHFHAILQNANGVPFRGNDPFYHGLAAIRVIIMEHDDIALFIIPLQCRKSIHQHDLAVAHGGLHGAAHQTHGPAEKKQYHNDDRRPQDRFSPFLY